MMDNGPSRFRPEMGELPALNDAGVDNIRTQGTLAKRKPPIADVMADNLTYGMSPAAIEAQELMTGIRNAYDVTRQYNRRYKAAAKAKSRLQENALKRANTQGKRTRRKLQSETKRRSKSVIRNYARNWLGMGTDLYR